MSGRRDAALSELTECSIFRREEVLSKEASFPNILEFALQQGIEDIQERLEQLAAKNKNGADRY